MKIQPIPTTTKGMYSAATCVFATHYSNAGASYTFYPLVKNPLQRVNGNTAANVISAPTLEFQTSSSLSVQISKDSDCEQHVFI